MKIVFFNTNFILMTKAEEFDKKNHKSFTLILIKFISTKNNFPCTLAPFLE